MKIKSRVAVTATLAVVALGLTACSGGGSSANSATSGTVTGVFDTQYKSALAPIVKDFEKKNPGVKVNINYAGGSDLASVILTQIQSGTAPDVIMSFPGGDANAKSASDNVITLAAQGHVLPLTADWQKDIPETWKSAVEYKGKLYGFPGAVQPLAAIYNETLLEKFGLKAPTTLDEVYKLCSDAKANGVYAYAQGLGDTAAGPQMLSFAQTATLIYGEDPTWDSGIASGKVSYTGSGWEKQFAIYEKMFKADCFGDGALGRSRTQGQDAVAQRQALGLVDVGAVLASIQKADSGDKFVVTGMPANNSGKTYITALPIYSLVVNAKAKNAAAAKAFVAFAGEPAEAAKYAKGFNMVPLIPNAAYKAPAELEAFSKLVQADKTAPLANVQPTVQTALNTSVQSMLLGNDTPKTAAQKLQDAYQK